MTQNSLIKKSSWDVSLDEFNKRILKDIYLNQHVSEDIRNEVEVVRDLLLHSYYNSNFIDEAYTKAIFLLEKVLRIRCKELRNGKSRVDLGDLFHWFFDNNYFETTEITELHALRKIRNKKVHSPKIFKGNLNYLINIYSIFDLINDVYEDVTLRLKRKEVIERINGQLNEICKNGFIVAINGNCFFGHFASVLFYNNKSEQSILTIRVARCIISEVAQIGIDRDNFELIEWTFVENSFVGKLTNNVSFSIKPLMGDSEKDQYKNWKTENPLWSLDLFDAMEPTNYKMKLREFYKI